MALSAADFLAQAIGPHIEIEYGPTFQNILKTQYLSAHTLQSYQRTLFAWSNNRCIGLVCAISTEEYWQRQRHSQQLLFEHDPINRLRCARSWMRQRLNGEVQGPWQTNQLYVQSLAVHADFRGQAIARQLLNSAARIYETQEANTELMRGTEQLSAQISPDNKASQQALQKAGFTQIPGPASQIKMIRSLEQPH